MNIDDLSLANRHPQRPKDWKEDEATYENWFADTLKVIQDLIWPVFDVPTKTWRGASVPDMEVLTRADLDLLRQIYNAFPQPIRQPIHSKIGTLGRKTHFDLFTEEDLEVSHWGTSYAHYDSNWTPDEIAKLQATILEGNDSKYGGSLLRFKNNLRRPRPYQMAMILDYTDFSYYEALSADTPSICCGHCMQSLLSVGTVMERLILTKQDFKPERWEALEQFAADIGDRRVMARVHYPSDNLSSWIIVMRIANHVFGTPEVKKRLWEAISERSFVYDLINSSGNPVYKAAMKELRDEANR
jgi:hypothetical protein